MPVYNKRGILLLPKVIVLNPKDGIYIVDGTSKCLHCQYRKILQTIFKK